MMEVQQDFKELLKLFNAHKMEMENGFVPIEIKTTERVSFADAKDLRMTDMLDKPIIHSLILSNDNQVKRIDKGITALPVAWFLG